MRILVTGADGYCGWPTVLKLLHQTDHNVVGVDNRSRRTWVEVDEQIIDLPIPEAHRIREHEVDRQYPDRYEFHFSQLQEYRTVKNLLGVLNPDVILHLASQPSAPYSERSVTHAQMTQENNIGMMRNILWAMRDLGMEDTHLVVTTTTGIYGAPEYIVPEGHVAIGNVAYPHPSMGGSWYHMTRAFDASMIWLAKYKWNLKITEMRTAIVVGYHTDETRYHETFRTRFDTGTHFGTVVNRFIAQALSGENLTVYGKGAQSKPLVSLNDFCESLVNITNCEYNENVDVFNQLQATMSIKDIAGAVREICYRKLGFDTEVKHIPNPRVENEDHTLIMNNGAFDRLIGGWDLSMVGFIQQTVLDVYAAMAERGWE